MKVYIYEYVERITHSYHDGGGLVIITDRSPLDAYNESVKGEGDEGDASLRRDALPRPDNIIEAVSATERVHVLPDAGCC